MIGTCLAREADSHEVLRYMILKRSTSLNLNSHAGSGSMSPNGSCHVAPHPYDRIVQRHPGIGAVESPSRKQQSGHQHNGVTQSRGAKRIGSHA